MTPKLRKVYFFGGCLIALWGVGTLIAGRLHYANYYGGMVFAPFAAVIGLTMIGIAVFAKDRRDVR
jgi:hypothetical protein